MPRRLSVAQARLVWWIIGIGFTLVMGLRHEVGGDWGAYDRQFSHVASLAFSKVVSTTDIGYHLLNWLVAQLSGSIYTVNLFCAAVMMWGAVVFCRRQPHPWLALLAAVPYMLVVVGMGYTRQAVALGFVLLGLSALGSGRVRVFVAWVIMGALFHKSAVLLLPIAALAASRNRFLTAFMVALTTALTYFLLLADSAESLWMNYVEAQYQSEGGAIRVAMNLVPALLLIIYRKRLVPEGQERKLWLLIALFAVMCVPLVGLASTAVDRVALYLIPLQLFVFARLPLLASTTRTRTLIVLGTVVYYAAVQFVWLNYATHAGYWVPYQFMPLWD